MLHTQTPTATQRACFGERGLAPLLAALLKDRSNVVLLANQRRIVSRNDAFVLRDSYGYTVSDPAAVLGTFYDVLNQTTGNLLVRGGSGASNDVITIDLR